MKEKTCTACGYQGVEDDCPTCKVPLKKSQTQSMTIIKSDSAKHMVYGIVYEPYIKDLQGDWAEPIEISKAAHDYVKRSRAVKTDHSANHDGISVVESYLAPVDFYWSNHYISKGTWIVGVEILNPEVWERVEKGELTGLSLHGHCAPPV